MSNQRMYTPADMAHELGVSKMTVRNWTNRYAEFLSEKASPPAGAQRAFTPRDRVVLAYINQLVNEGHRHGYIRDRMRETTFNENEATPADILAGVTDAAQNPTDAAHATLSRVQEPTTAAVMQAFTTVYDERIKNANHRLDRIADQQQRMLMLGLGAGIITGMVFMGIIIALLLVMLR